MTPEEALCKYLRSQKGKWLTTKFPVSYDNPGKLSFMITGVQHQKKVSIYAMESWGMTSLINFSVRLLGEKWARSRLIDEDLGYIIEEYVAEICQKYIPISPECSITCLIHSKTGRPLWPDKEFIEGNWDEPYFIRRFIKKFL